MVSFHLSGWYKACLLRWLLSLLLCNRTRFCKKQGINSPIWNFLTYSCHFLCEGIRERKQTPVLQEVAHLSLALSNFPGSCIHLTCSICVVIVKPLWWVSFCWNFCLAKQADRISLNDVGRVDFGLWKLIWFWVDVLSTEGRIAELGNLPGSAECKHHLNLHPNRFIDSSFHSPFWGVTTWTLLASGGATAKRIVHLPRTSPLVRSEALTVYVPVTGKSKKYKKQKV